MKIAIKLLTLLVAGALLKGFLDMHAAIESGASVQSVVVPAMPIVIIALLTIAGLGKIEGKIAEEENDSSTSPKH